MNAHTLAILELSGEMEAAKAGHEQAIRELLDSELFFVGGGQGDVTWNTPTPNP